MIPEIYSDSLMFPVVANQVVKAARSESKETVAHKKISRILRKIYQELNGHKFNSKFKELVKIHSHRYDYFVVILSVLRAKKCIGAAWELYQDRMDQF
jgi:hypothetical protein